ncbi:hypothetical protein HUS23_07970 [Ectothiorhodospiraceae bacterium 2226]|nr:hypothetical protein HUS23_07970 [Ectothiorhodospiraceae bacterium 2226]
MLALAAAALVAGCGGPQFLVHGYPPRGAEMPEVMLGVGERQAIVRHRLGPTSIGGGYHWGLIADDPTVAAIGYADEGGRSTAVLTGLAPGATRVYYVNRHAYPDPTRARGAYVTDEEAPPHHAGFRVTVTAAPR